jgi:hypothetical protein
MADTGVARIDKLFAGDDTQRIALGDSEKEAVGMIQDLLSGHGRKMPGVREADWGTFGPKTRAAVLAFRKSVDLPAAKKSDGIVDAATLQALVREPASTPRASRAYLTLALDISYDTWARMVSLVALVEGQGKFAAFNANNDLAGLTLGIIQWAQKPGRLAELLKKFRGEQPDRMNEIFAGKANVDGMITHAQLFTFDPKHPKRCVVCGGVDHDTGESANKKQYDFIRAPWAARFKAATRELPLQIAQVHLAMEAFKDSYTKYVKPNATLVKTDRGVGFLLDVCNQRGSDGFVAFHKAIMAAAAPPTTESDYLDRMTEKRVAQLTAQYKKSPEIQKREVAAVRARSAFFRTSPLLFDSPFTP